MTSLRTDTTHSYLLTEEIKNNGEHMKIIVTDIENLNIKVDGEYKIISPESDIHNCIGCFGCWVKTPGKCVIKDGYENMGQYLSRSEQIIYISECCYGSVSPFVKMVQDRSLAYIHPYFEIRNGEMHHKRRYENVITVSAYFYGENISEKEKITAERIVRANAVNYDGKVGKVCFLNSEKELEDVIL